MERLYMKLLADEIIYKISTLRKMHLPGTHCVTVCTDGAASSVCSNNGLK